MLKRSHIKVRVCSGDEFLPKLDELKANGYKFHSFHCMGGGVYELEVDHDTQTAKPLFGIPGVVLALAVFKEQTE